MQYRQARQDEVQEVAQVCADAFEDYPYLSMIASNLKKPEQYKEFVLALQEMLVRLAIKMDSCLVAEQDGRIVAVAILQHQTVSMLNYLQNGVLPSCLNILTSSKNPRDIWKILQNTTGT